MTGLLMCVACVDQPELVDLSALDVCAIANDGDLCDDHQACTYPDVCLNKKCIGTPVADGTRCTDGNVCTSGDQCMAAVCVGTVLADGTACTDGDPCTDPDLCQQGVCQSGGPAICDDGNACTIDSCAPGVGCVFAPRDCAMPVDASAPDVMTADTAADTTTGGDVAPPDAVITDGPAADVTDGPAPPDVAPPVDTGIGTDVAPPDAGTGVDADADASADTDAADAADDVRDAALDLQETPPDLRARGGGCACALSSGDPGARGDRRGDGGGAALSFTALVALLALRRRGACRKLVRRPGARAAARTRRGWHG